jgi:hypothetical protein
MSTSPPAGVTVDTTTLAIYRFNGVFWDSNSMVDQSVSADTSPSTLRSKLNES